MSFLTRLFGKGKKRINLEVTKLGEEKTEPKAEGMGTTLRKPEEAPASPQKKEDPELTALEMAKRRGWEVKTLPTWKPGDVILDTYEVEDVISCGMGHVYIANHNKWNVKLAIKPPNEKMLFDKDFFPSILRMGLHPNIAYCYYIRNIEEVPHIFIEYVNGGNLRQWFEEGKCIDYRTNLNLATQFCHGMEHAHSKGIIHHGIKPENVLMTKDGTLKISDFGLLGTDFGTLGGAKDYMAPEQFEDPHNVDERANIFSFGVCLYEMFCGNKPYEVTTGPKQQAPDPIAMSGSKNFPKQIASVMAKTIQWEPLDRYSSFKEIGKELIQIYQMIYKEKSLYSDLKLVNIEADGLNNLGVSYFELGKKADAVSCWKKAIEINHTHLEATYNFSLVEWRDGDIEYPEVLRRLDNCSNSFTNRERLSELKAFIHAEGFKRDAARDVLKMLPGRYEDVFSGKNIGQIDCQKALKGGFKFFTSVSLSSDARYAVSADGSKSFTIWDFLTGQLRDINKGHTDQVNSVSLTSDGRYAVSGSKDKTLRLWDLETGECLRTMGGHTGWVNAISLTPDARFVVSGGDDNVLRLWDLETGRCMRTMKGHVSSITTVAITADGRYAVSGSKDKTLRLWDTETGQCACTMKGHTGLVNSVSLTPDGRFVLSGSEDKALRLWDLETGQCLRIMKGHVSSITTVAITADGRYAISGSEDKALLLWDLETGRRLYTCNNPLNVGSAFSASLTPDGRFAISGGDFPSAVQIWSFEIGEPYRAEPMLSSLKDFEQRKKEEDLLEEAIRKAEELYKKGDHKQSFSILYKAWKDTGFSHKDEIHRLYSRLIKKGRIKDLTFSFQKKMLGGHTNGIVEASITPDGRYAVSGSKDKTVRLWNLETGQCLRIMEGHTDKVLTVFPTPDGRYAVSGGEDNTLRLWTLETGQCVRTMKGHTDTVHSVSLTQNGRYAVSGSKDKTLRKWDLETGQCLCIMEGHTIDVNRVSITPDGRYAISGSKDKTLRLWDLENGQCLRTMQGHTDEVLAVSLTSDGKYAVSGSGDDENALRLWDLRNGRCVCTMEGHTRKVLSVALTPNGRYAVSGSVDKTLRVWDTETGKCLCAMEADILYVSSVSLNQDGRYAVSVGSDTMALWEFIWDLAFD